MDMYGKAASSLCGFFFSLYVYEAHLLPARLSTITPQQTMFEPSMTWMQKCQALQRYYYNNIAATASPPSLCKHARQQNQTPNSSKKSDGGGGGGFGAAAAAAAAVGFGPGGGGGLLLMWAWAAKASSSPAVPVPLALGAGRGEGGGGGEAFRSALPACDELLLPTCPSSSRSSSSSLQSSACKKEC